MDDTENKKRFVITRGMVLLIIILIIILILLVVFLKPKRAQKVNGITVDECKRLENRIKEEVPIYLYQKNITLTSEPIRIDLSELLLKNGGSIDESKYAATEYCKGYAIAAKKTVDEISSYVSCGKIYATKGYVDADNNVTTTTSPVTDSVTPVITLVGEAVIEITVGDKYEEPGVKAIDNVDGDITSMVKVAGSADTSKAGEYIIKYYVTDAHNNTAEAERKIIVHDKVTTTTAKANKEVTNKTTTKAAKSAPTIIVRGESVVRISVGQTYLDGGATAVDCDGNDITSRINVTGSVNTSIAGTYIINYSITDKYGKTSSAQRKVIVSQVVEVQSITITPNSLELRVNQSGKLEVSISPKNATNSSLTWSSDNSGVATVSLDGTVTAKGKGTTTIKVKTANGKEAISRITVK